MRNANRLDNLIVELLEISRIENARLNFKFVKKNLVIEIKHVIYEMQNYLPQKKIRIISKISRLPIIEFDRERLKQVLRNLLSNAKKFSNNNSKIIVGAEVKGSHILVSIKDFGIGILAENKKKIFEPFFRESRLNQENTDILVYGGTGLGLVICKGIVEAQNGRLWFESEEGKGSTFYFTLPLRPVRTPKPVTAVFFSEANFEKIVRDIFVKYLGPLGAQEFNELKDSGLSHKSIKQKIKTLLDAGIVSKEIHDSIKQEVHYANPSFKWHED